MIGIISKEVIGPCATACDDRANVLWEKEDRKKKIEKEGNKGQENKKINATKQNGQTLLGQQTMLSSIIADKSRLQM